jgi:hypothetical protein
MILNAEDRLISYREFCDLLRTQRGASGWTG